MLENLSRERSLAREELTLSDFLVGVLIGGFTICLINQKEEKLTNHIYKKEHENCYTLMLNGQHDWEMLRSGLIPLYQCRNCPMTRDQYFQHGQPTCPGQEECLTCKRQF